MTWSNCYASTEEDFLLGLSWGEGSYYVRMVCELLTALGSCAYLIGAAREARFQGAQMFVENLVSRINLIGSTYFILWTVAHVPLHTDY